MPDDGVMTQDIDDGEQLDAAPLEALVSEGEASEVITA